MIVTGISFQKNLLICIKAEYIQLVKQSNTVAKLRIYKRIRGGGY